ncbi:hypothetical protein PsorP6_003491 [Peronosclerospora sorghi]|uniref:Uncharacterized protein n=1 Tax=Peronosclerospora sorghi TaxID=230839 RepID=A0ACC0VPI6_9STRA|nr:hypothetical protein PsorP6_003491 [Peronosclerospora sorghi]
MVTAQTLLHRFYYRKSLCQFDAFRVAISCLFLAAKVEENPKRIKEVISVFYAMFRRRKWNRSMVTQQLIDLDGGTFSQWRKWLIMVERQVLIDLGFSVYNVTEHPHKYVLYYVKVLDGSSKLAQQAWGYINDSLRIDLCVRYKAQVIACAAIFLASRFQAVALPENPSWYSLFDVEKSQMYEVSVVIMQLYKQEKVKWLEPLTETNPFAVDDYPDHELKTNAVEQKTTMEHSPQKISTLDLPIPATNNNSQEVKTSSARKAHMTSRWNDRSIKSRRDCSPSQGSSRSIRSNTSKREVLSSRSYRKRIRSRSVDRSRSSQTRRRRSHSYSRSRSRSRSVDRSKSSQTRRRRSRSYSRSRSRSADGSRAKRSQKRRSYSYRHGHSKVLLVAGDHDPSRRTPHT